MRCPNCLEELKEGSKGFFWCWNCDYTHYTKDYKKEPRDHTLLSKVFQTLGEDKP